MKGARGAAMTYPTKAVVLVVALGAGVLGYEAYQHARHVHVLNGRIELVLDQNARIVEQTQRLADLVGQYRDELDDLRADLDAPKPPVTVPVRRSDHDPNRHEQRIGNLEYDRYGQKGQP